MCDKFESIAGVSRPEESGDSSAMDINLLSDSSLGFLFTASHSKAVTTSSLSLASNQRTRNQPLGR